MLTDGISYQASHTRYDGTMTTTDQRYTIGELAHLCSVPVRRIRFYSDKGLLPPASRTRANYRVYSDADAARYIDVLQHWIED